MRRRIKAADSSGAQFMHPVHRRTIAVLRRRLGIASAFGTSRRFATAPQFGRFRSEADMNQQARLAGSIENDPCATLAAEFAVMHKTVL